MAEIAGVEEWTVSTPAISLLTVMQQLTRSQLTTTCAAPLRHVSPLLFAMYSRSSSINVQALTEDERTL